MTLNFSDALVDFENLNSLDTIVHHSNEEEGKIDFVLINIKLRPS